MPTPLPAALNPLDLANLTEATVGGGGSFDVLMAATRAHLQKEFETGRIKGTEYSTLYLGALQSVLQTSMSFLLQKQAANQDALIKAKQLDLMDIQLQTAGQQLALVTAQVAQTEAQTAQITAQTAQVTLQNALIEAQTSHAEAQAAQITAQTAHVAKQSLQTEAQTSQITAETALTTARTANAALEGDVLVAQKCKLQAEYDVLMLTKPKTEAETGLLLQKGLTEKAQTIALGVDEDSVVGAQKALYRAQINGFRSDARQKAAKLMVDTWNVRRTTDEGTSANATNKLDDASVGAVVGVLMEDVGA